MTRTLTSSPSLAGGSANTGGCSGCCDRVVFTGVADGVDGPCSQGAVAVVWLEGIDVGAVFAVLVEFLDPNAWHPNPIQTAEGSSNPHMVRRPRMIGSRWVEFRIRG